MKMMEEMTGGRLGRQWRVRRVMIMQQKLLRQMSALPNAHVHIIRAQQRFH